MVGLTFDDGYADNVEEGLPLLRELGFTATCYVTSGHLGGFNAWDADELRVRTSRDARAILDRLGSVAVDRQVDEELIEDQVLRASFLVERKHVPAFDKAMDELASGQAGRIDFKYVGPLPPHSFVGLEVR